MKELEPNCLNSVRVIDGSPVAKDKGNTVLFDRLFDEEPNKYFTRVSPMKNGRDAVSKAASYRLAEVPRWLNDFVRFA